MSGLGLPSRGRWRQRATGRRGVRWGLTLIELMLALALTAVVLVLIGLAIDIHLRMLDGRRSEVEQAQLARAIMKQIADDLRCALQTSTTDFSGVAALAGASASGVDAEDLESLADLGSAMESLGLSESEETESATDIATSTELPPTPGLYGNQFQLQVDVSRLPRVDEFQRMVDPSRPTGVQDIPSGIKTVAYYVRDPGVRPTVTGSPSLAGEATGGLVRRVLDRAVTLWASENGDISSLDDYGTVIAPEVTYIEFQYSDGTQWLSEWDSEQQGGLPVAIQIRLALAANQPETSTLNSSMTLGSPVAATPEKVISLTVHLLTGKPCEGSTSSTEDAGGMEALGL